jgi:leader peptidase (prepilin peptidase)/N-methyltransferase
MGSPSIAARTNAPPSVHGAGARAVTAPRLRALLAFGVIALAFATPSIDRALVYAVVAGVLVVVAAIDLERRTIPNRIVLPASTVVLVMNVVLFPSRAAEWVLAGVIAAAVFAAPTLLGRNWVGIGDAKLALLLGAALGWAVAGAVLIASLLTIPVSVWLFIRRGAAARRATIPFAPFLALGAMLVMFGPTLAGLS